MWTVDIDVGGTLTDGLFTSGDNVISVKVDTTPHDLTVCLFDCLAQAAAKLEFPDTVTFLENVELIRWSTTITSNPAPAARHAIAVPMTPPPATTISAVTAKTTPFAGITRIRFDGRRPVQPPSQPQPEAPVTGTCRRIQCKTTSLPVSGGDWIAR